MSNNPGFIDYLSLVPLATSCEETIDGLIYRDNDGVVLNGASEEDILTERLRGEAFHASRQYARNRRVQYNLLNQDEMRYDDLINTTTTWQDAINAIKVANPKP